MKSDNNMCECYQTPESYRKVAAKAVEEAADYLEGISPKFKVQAILLRKRANKLRKGESAGEQN